MSDTTAILTYFRYYLVCPRPYLIGVRVAKAALVKDVLARDASSKNTYLGIRLSGASYQLSMKQDFINMH